MSSLRQTSRQISSHKFLPHNWHSKIEIFVAVKSLGDSLWTHGLLHAGVLCPPLSPEICSNSCPLSRWYYLTISSSASPFSSCSQSFPESGYFPMSQLFTSGSQRTGASSSVLPMNIQGWFPLRLTGLISSESKRLSKIFSSTTIQKYQFFGPQLSYDLTLTLVCDYWKNHSFDNMDVCWQNVISAL